MAANAVIGVDWAVRLDNLRSQMAQVPGIGADAAKRLTAQLSKEMRSAEAASKKLATEMKKTGDVAETSGARALKALGPLGGLLARISPEAGAVAASIAGLTSAFEGLGASGVAAGLTLDVAIPVLGAVALAVGAAALAYRQYSIEAEAAKIQQELLTKGAADVVVWAKREQEAAYHLADTVGTLTDAQREKHALDQIDIDLAKTQGPLLEQQGALVRDLAAANASGAIQQGQAITWRIKQIQAEVDAQTARAQTVKRLTSEELGYNAAKAESAAALARREQDLAKQKTDASASAASVAAEAALTEELLKQAAAAQAAADKFRSHMAAVEADSAAADAMVQASGAFRQTELDKLAAAQDRALRDYFAKAQAGGQQTDALLSGLLAIRTNQEEEFTAKVAEEADKRATISAASVQASIDAQVAAAETALQTLNQVGQYVQQALAMASSAMTESYQSSMDLAMRLDEQLAAGEEYYTASQKAALAERAEQARQSAIDEFNAAKAVKIAEAIAATSLAAINAIAQYPPPSPVGMIGAGIAVAAGLVAIGEIASTEPAFHSGFAPDEMSARVLRQEAVLSPTATAAVGSDRIRELNAGKTRGEYAGPAPVIIGHRVMDELIKRELRAQGALAVALADGRALGHRVNRRGTNG